MNQTIPQTGRTELRNHYLGLSQQVTQWCEANGLGSSFAVGVTCGHRQGGTSTVAFNLAAALSITSDEKVALLQTNVAHPFSDSGSGSGSQFRCSPGFTDLLKGEASLEHCLQKTAFSGMQVVTSGETPRGEVLALPYQNTSHVLDQLRSQFTMVVVDLPIADSLTPCRALAKSLDGSLIVVEQDHYVPDSFERIRKQLSEVIGIVINKQH